MFGTAHMYRQKHKNKRRHEPKNTTDKHKKSKPNRLWWKTFVKLVEICA